MKTVVFGLLGPTLDQGSGDNRWQRWRPSVAVCQHEDLLVHRFELLYQQRYAALADRLLADLAAVAPETRVNLHPVDLANPWDFEQVYGSLYEFAHAYRFREDEEYLVHITTGTHVAQICLYLLTEARYFPARLLQTSPGRRNQKRVEGSYSIIDLDLSKYDQIATRFRQEQAAGVSFLKSGIATRNKIFNQMMEQIEQVAIHSSSPLLLMGPTGAGKSQLAKRIFQLKKQRHQMQGEFVAVNCATLRGDGAMSTLFGHKKGAFTGASQDRPGLLVRANGGMLFLDEIAELGLDEQAMLLHALEEKRFFPVGADGEVESRFQLLAGTNQDLTKNVRRGKFREDLLSRINMWPFRLPGLQDRPEDIEPNLEYEIDKYSRENQTQLRFSKEARTDYLRFACCKAASWRGNFRDLNSSINRMAILGGGQRITQSMVNQEIQRLQELWREEDHEETLLKDILEESALQNMDWFTRIQLEGVVKVCRQSKSLADAGRKLFFHSRQKKTKPNDSDRLKKYLARYGLNWEDLLSD